MSRILPRYTDQAVNTDPLEIMLAKRQAQEDQARTAINNGNAGQMADPADLRGIPCIARGVGGTSPGTNPLTETIARDTRNIRRPHVSS